MANSCKPYRYVNERLCVCVCKCVVLCIFIYSLLVCIQAHRDQVCAELEETKSRLKTSSALLGQKTMELDQALTQAEEARIHGAQEKEEQRRRQEERDAQIRRMEELIEEELEEFQKQLDTKDEEVRRRGVCTRLRSASEMGIGGKTISNRPGRVRLTATVTSTPQVAEEREKWEEERQEKEQELRAARRLLEEQREEREVEVRALLDRQRLALEEAAAALRRSHQEEVRALREEHRKEVEELEARAGAELCEQRAAMEEEQRRQISLIKQVDTHTHT